MDLIREGNVLNFIDDVIIAIKDYITHKNVLENVSKLLAENQLTINREKSEFCKKSIVYLGQTVDSEGITL